MVWISSTSYSMVMLLVMGVRVPLAPVLMVCDGTRRTRAWSKEIVELYRDSRTLGPEPAGTLMAS